MSSMAAPIAPERRAGGQALDHPGRQQLGDAAGGGERSPASTACTAIAVSSTGRRPTWSDSRPRVSSAASTAIAYTPNTTVVVIGEKPHSAW